MDMITITASQELSELKLEPLIGRRGKIIEMLHHKDGTCRGAWVSLEGSPYLNESEWFIPTQSLTNDYSQERK